MDPIRASLRALWMRLIGLEEQLAEERWLGLPLGVRSAEDAVLWEPEPGRVYSWGTARVA